MSAVLSVREARKRFGATHALDGADLKLNEGELLLPLGPNGAGKTTMVRAIAGRVRLDGGGVTLFGQDLSAGDHVARHRLGVVPQEIALYPLLTARENLEVFGRLHGLDRDAIKKQSDWALEWTGLKDRDREPIKRFSGGMKRRLNIACGVLHRPTVILLDEPTVGVDPQSRERIWDMLANLRKGGVSLVLTTHQLDEAQTRCDRIVIIDHGKTVAAGTLNDLIERSVGRGRKITLLLDRQLPQPMLGWHGSDDGLSVHGQISDVAAELPPLLERIRACGSHVQDIAIEGPSLHAVFLNLTGRELRQ